MLDNKKTNSSHILVYVCSHIFNNTKPVLYVVRELDGGRQFLCGENHEEGELPRIIGLDHLLSRDSSLFEIEDLAIGWEAEREEMGGKWVLRKHNFVD